MQDEERSLERLLRVSRWAGLAPYKTLHPLRVSTGFAVYGRLIFVFCVLLGLYQMYRWEINLHQFKISILMPAATILCALGIFYHGMFNAPRRIRRITVLMRHLKKIRRHIGRMRKPDPAQRQACILFIVIQTSTVFLATVTRLHNAIANVNIINATLLLFLGNMATMQFVLVALAINSCFCAINDRLEEILLNAQTRADKPHKKLRSLSQAYVTTCDLVRQQNDCDKVLLLFLFVNIIGNMVRVVNDLISSIKDSGSDYIFLMVIGMMWYILNVCRGMLLAVPNHAISSEAGRSCNLLCMLMYTVHSLEEPLLDEVEEFLLHLKLNQPSYGFLGIYNMNRRLVVTMIVVGTTYLATFQGF